MLIRQLLKAVPIVVLGAGLVKGVGKSKSFFEATKTIGVQSEVNALASLVRMEAMTGDMPDPEHFSDYVRKNMQLKENIKRDPAVDMWGTPYMLVPGARTVKVLSAGLDKTPNTSDDVVAEFTL